MNRRLLALVALLALAGVARATTMVPLDLQALTRRADRIVYGQVESMQASWTPDHDAIYTDVKVRVMRAYKGAVKAGDLVTVRRPGGTVDGIAMKVFGAAVFRPGEELVLFIERRGTASWVVGMSQGELRVTTAADGSKTVLAPDLAEVSLLPSQRPLRPMRARPLADFEQELLELVKAGR